MSRILGVITIFSLGATLVVSRLYWRSQSELLKLQKQLKKSHLQLEKTKNEFSQRLAQYSQDLHQAEAKTNQAEQIKNEFLGKISHEFRNPLHTILGYTQLLERRMLLDRVSQESLQEIHRSGEHLLTLIENILEIVQLETQQLNLKETSFNLRKTLEILEFSLQPLALTKGIQLIFCLPEELPPAIKADEVKLRQIILILLENALKCTQKGHITLRVGIADQEWLNEEEENDSPQPSSYSVLFEIEDTGIGIARENLERIFQPFEFSNSEINSDRGIGLELAIAQRLAHLMGGEISIDSVIGQGTLTKFSVPVQGDEEEAWEGMLRGTGRIIAIAPHQGEYRVLVVDDRHENRQLLLKLLIPLGFQVKEAANGQEAISFWSTWRPQLIWIDTRMPIMGGKEAIQQIRHLESLAISPGSEPDLQTIIIASVTGTLEEEATELLAIGCNDVLRKPFEIETILDKIAQHLGVRYLYETDYSENDLGSDEDEEMSTLPLTNLPQKKPSFSATFPPQTLKSHQYLPQPLHSQSLEIMTSEWIESVYHSASAGDSDRISELLAEIPKTHSSLSTALKTLALQFNFRKIRELCQLANANQVKKETENSY
jgi:signal transduction histidine kinase/DNA-binding response OmpR family regulator